MDAPDPGPSPRARPLWHRQDAYGTVLALIAVSLVLEALRGAVPGATVAAVVVRAFTLALVLRTSRDPVESRPLDGVLLVLALAVAGSVFAEADDGLGLAVTSAALCVVSALQLAVIARRLMHHTEVDQRTAAGALSIYLLLGSFFAGLYGVLAAATAEPLFANGTNGTALERVYFSFVTLTTVGFGDLTPGSDLARVAVVLQALLGQLYLVTVVALVVGRLRIRPGADGPPPA